MSSAAGSADWSAAEFFAGIGLAGLGMSQAGIRTVWSNDISPSKKAMFEEHFGETAGKSFRVQDLGTLTSEQLPPAVDVAWASFPCTDLSLAGGRAGLHRGVASSTFWHFIKVISKLGSSRPAVIALENVTAFATSHSGKDIASAIRSLNGLGYSVDVVSIDARHFVPQSRPRLFLIGVQMEIASVESASVLRPDWLTPIFQDQTLKTHRMELPDLPPALDGGLADSLEKLDPGDTRWWPENRVASFIESLSTVQLTRFSALRAGPNVEFRTAYRRMRKGVARWEMRDDSIAGCLRTASGGSSKQAVVELGQGAVRIRWMTPREYATLMGVPDYSISGVTDNQAYSGFGDAVCMPVVGWLSRNYLVPVLKAAAASESDVPNPTTSPGEYALEPAS